MSPLAIDAGLKEYAPLVRKIARQLLLKLPPNIELDDLIQTGMIALAEVMPKYDKSFGASFETYAAYRIRGSMIDEVRRFGERKKRIRQHEREIDDATRKLSHDLGRAPIESEVAIELELSLPGYQELIDNVLGIGTVYLEDLQADGEDFFDRNAIPEGRDPLSLLQEQRRRAALSAAIAILPAHERRLMTLYYEEAMKLSDIGVMLGISESWASIQLARIITKLRIRLRQH